MRIRPLLALSAAALAFGAAPRPVAAQDAYWSYAAKFVCGFQRPLTTGGEGSVKSGNYATEINIHNPFYQEPVPIRKKVVLLEERGQPLGHEPRQSQPIAFDGIELGPDNATMDNCNRIWTLVHPTIPPPTPLPLFIGYLVLISKAELDVDVVYTAAAPGGVAGALSRAISIDVERVTGRRVPIGAAAFPGGPDILKPQQPLQQ